MPGTPTPYYGFPIPADNDPADAPHDFQALAQKVEDTLKNGYTIPSGSLTIGDPVAGVGAQYLALSKKVATDVLELRFVWYNDGLLIQGNKNNAQDPARASYVLGTDGAITAYTYTPSTVGRPVPFAMYAYQASVVFSNAVASTAVVTYPAGRFTQNPTVQCTSMNSNFHATLTSGATTSVTIAARHVDNTASSVTIGVQVLAVQMTPTSGPG